MPLYAHSRIEHQGRVWDRGDRVPDNLPGIEALVEAGSVSFDRYVAPPRTPQNLVEIESQTQTLRDRYARDELTLTEFESAVDELLELEKKLDLM